MLLVGLIAAVALANVLFACTNNKKALTVSVAVYWMAVSIYWIAKMWEG